MALLLSQWMLLSSLYSFYFVSTWGCQVVSWSYSCRLRRADPQVGVWQRTRAKNKYKTYDKPHRRPWQWIKIRAKTFNNDASWPHMGLFKFSVILWCTTIEWLWSLPTRVDQRLLYQWERQLLVHNYLMFPDEEWELSPFAAQKYDNRCSESKRQLYCSASMYDIKFFDTLF